MLRIEHEGTLPNWRRLRVSAKWISGFPKMNCMKFEDWYKHEIGGIQGYMKGGNYWNEPIQKGKSKGSGENAGGFSF